MNIDIKSILATGERVTLECKKAQHSVPNSLWDTYSAFANTYGGIILLGVVEYTEEKDNAWNEKHWIRPELVEQTELMQVKLTLYFENDPVNGVKDGVKDGVKELSEVQMVIVDEIRRNPNITTNEMAQKTGIKFRTLQRYISQLQTLGILVREGGRKDGYWVVK